MGRRGVDLYLQLSQGETTAGTNAAVVLDGRASDNGAELVDGSGSQGSSLSGAHIATADLLGSLFPNAIVRTVGHHHYRGREIFLAASPYRQVVPGRSGIEPDAANPCGSLNSKSSAQLSYSPSDFLSSLVRGRTVLLDLVVVLDRL
jgi:hypothetical protein